MLEFSPSEVDWRNANSKRYRIATTAEIVGFTWQYILLIWSDYRFLNPFWFSRVYKQKEETSTFPMAYLATGAIKELFQRFKQSNIFLGLKIP